jgi:hypothetical protein
MALLGGKDIVAVSGRTIEKWSAHDEPMTALKRMGSLVGVSSMDGSISLIKL